MSSPTVTKRIANEAEYILTSKVGDVNGSTVSAREYGNSYYHRTVLTLASTPVETNGGASNAIEYGGVKIYDFPQGVVGFSLGVGSFTVAMTNAMQNLFNDGTPEGDISVGDTAVNSAEALGSSDVSDDSFVGAIAYTMDSYAVATAVQGMNDQFTAAAMLYNGLSTAPDVYLNISIDASEKIDTTAVTLLVSGTVILCWQFAGDV